MIYVIMGAPCSGKTEIRKEFFDNCDYIDIYDYQENCFTLEQLQQAEDNFLHDLLKKINSKPKERVFVIEHCFSSAKRRKKYISAIRHELDYTEEINCILVWPRNEDIEYLVKQKLKTEDENTIKRFIDYALEWYGLFDIPTKADGFDRIYKIVPYIEEETC